MPTIGVNLVLSSGKTNLSLQLFASGVLLNTGGDALVEVGTSGFFQASVDEAITATLDAIVLEGAVAVYGGTLYLGQSQVDRVAPAPSAIANATALLNIQVLAGVSYLDHFTSLATLAIIGEPNSDTLVDDIFAVRDGLALEATLTAMAGDGFNTATDSLEAIRAAVDEIEIPTPTGPWTRTITVTDSVSGDPIEGASVRFFRTGETETKATNSSGVASFTVESATWSYAIVASGYAGASGTAVVDASGDTAVALVANAPAPPANPNNATLRVTCIGEDSQVAPGAIVSIRMIEAPASQVGFGYDGTIATFTADVNGIAEREVARGATYEIRREGTYKQWQQFVMPTDEDLILIESFVQP